MPRLTFGGPPKELAADFPLICLTHNQIRVQRLSVFYCMSIKVPQLTFGCPPNELAADFPLNLFDTLIEFAANKSRVLKLNN